MKTHRSGLLLGLAAALLWSVGGAARADNKLESYDLDGVDAHSVQRALAPLLTENARLSRLDNALLVVGTADDQAVVRQLLAMLRGKPVPHAAQYMITIVQGASPKQARKLLAGKSMGSAWSRNTRDQAQITSLRVTAGKAAHVDSTEVRSAIDAASLDSAYDGGGGFQTRDVVLSRGFAVHAAPIGREVEVTIEPFTSGRDPTQIDERREDSLETQVIIPLDKWVAIAVDSKLDDGSSSTYSTSAAFEPTHTLLRVTLLAN